MSAVVRHPELLCPAGDFEAMKAAVANGADAVYFGLPAFNARHRATNFTLESLPQTMRYLHRHNVKGFVALNVLIFSDELPEAVEYIRAIAAAGVDAVIVQDLGLVKLIKTVAPKLEVHSSTQMTLTEPRGVAFARSLGVERVVLAREMSVAEIAKVTAAVPDMPVEVFVHGAICVAYSGQCLTSESFGGRSANRGQCAQACRMPYDLIVDGARRSLPDDIKYLVSPTDLGGWDLIESLTHAGVASFKIEGRLKGANYVAQTAQVYRQAIDAAIVGTPWSASESQEAALTQVYSRGFTHGFLDGVNHQRLVPGRFPKARGLKLGTLVDVTRNGFVVSIDASTQQPNPGDAIVFDEGNPEDDEAYGQIYTVREWRNTYQSSRRVLSEANPRVPPGARTILIELGNRDARPEDVEIGAVVWKTSDPQLNKQIESTYARDRVVHRAPVDMILHAHVGANATLTITDGTHTVESEYPQALAPALKFPINEEAARRQLDRLLDTPFVLGTLTLDVAGGPMVPNSILAELRRSAVDQLVELRHQATVSETTEWHRLSAHASRTLAGSPCHELHVLARTLEQVDALLALPDDVRPQTVYCDFEDVRRNKPAVDQCRAAGVPIALATIRIIKPGEEGWLNQVLICEPDAVIVRNLAGIGFFKEKAPNLPLIGDFSLNIANELTAQILREANLVRAVPSYDLSWNQMRAMLSRFDPGWFECVVHQHMPMFHMEHCVFAHTLSTGKDFRDCGRPCETHQVDLRDSVTRKSHPLIPDAGCRNTLFNADAQSALVYIPRMIEAGIRHFRLELLRQSGEEVGAIVRQYRDVLDGKLPSKAALRSLRITSQLGVTAGTLDRE
jgi:U32 family peptidase